MLNVEEQIADIRERLAAMETTLSLVQQSMSNMVGAKSGGHVVIPVATVVTVVEIVKVIIERMA